MKKFLLLFWPEEGNVDKIANDIVNKLGASKVDSLPISKASKAILENSDHWILGGSTVGSHTWEDADDSNKWNDFFGLLNDIDLSSKTVAFYGLGDQVLYPDHFVDGLGIFHEEFKKRNTKIVGQWPTKGYNFSDSEGVNGDQFYGLALDEDQEEELSSSRLDRWLEVVLKEFGR